MRRIASDKKGNNRKYLQIYGKSILPLAGESVNAADGDRADSPREKSPAAVTTATFSEQTIIF
jgi:hypothetical protein